MSEAILSHRALTTTRHSSISTARNCPKVSASNLTIGFGSRKITQTSHDKDTRLAHRLVATKISDDSIELIAPYKTKTLNPKCSEFVPKQKSISKCTNPATAIWIQSQNYDASGPVPQRQLVAPQPSISGRSGGILNWASKTYLHGASAMRKELDNNRQSKHFRNPTRHQFQNATIKPLPSSPWKQDNTDYAATIGRSNADPFEDMESRRSPPIQPLYRNTNDRNYPLCFVYKVVAKKVTKAEDAAGSTVQTYQEIHFESNKDANIYILKKVQEVEDEMKDDPLVVCGLVTNEKGVKWFRLGDWLWSIDKQRMPTAPRCWNQKMSFRKIISRCARMGRGASSHHRKDSGWTTSC